VGILHIDVTRKSFSLNSHETGAMAGVTFSGEEEVRHFHIKLYSYFEPYSSPRQGRAGAGDDSADDAVDSWKDGTGI